MEKKEKEVFAASLKIAGDASEKLAKLLNNLTEKFEVACESVEETCKECKDVGACGGTCTDGSCCRYDLMKENEELREKLEKLRKENKQFFVERLKAQRSASNCKKAIHNIEVDDAKFIRGYKSVDSYSKKKIHSRRMYGISR